MTSATILKFTGSASLMWTTETISNNYSYIIQLSLFACLIIINLFLILIIFTLSFTLFFYVQGIHQSIKQELAWIRGHRKWPEPLAIMRSRDYRKKRDSHHRHRHCQIVNRSSALLHKQDYFHDSSVNVKDNAITSQFLINSLPLQTHDQVIQCIDESVYQLQLCATKS